ncbi:MAG: tetratricopeptide repeat protein, partial [Actinomycetota bacterium]|nr:tetratricopeptide repeat protein [Actinomycetota bacterium]
LLAYVLTRNDPAPATVVTRIQRVTTHGRITTVEKPVTVTTPASPPPTATPAAPSGAALNNAGFRKMQAGDYAGALPLLESAVQKLQGTNSLDEAYADYNLAFTRFQLGNCDGVLELLDRSESIQGQRAAIDRLRQQAQEDC